MLIFERSVLVNGRHGTTFYTKYLGACHCVLAVPTPTVLKYSKDNIVYAEGRVQFPFRNGV